MQARFLGLRDYQLQLIERIRSTADAETTSTHLGFDAAEELWAVPLTEVSEVIPMSPLASVPLTKSWFMGVANIRGCLYAVTDFACFVGGHATPLTAECRLVLLQERYRAHSALLIRRSLGLRQLRSGSPPDATANAWQSASFRDAEGQVWHELAVRRLTTNQKFLAAGIHEDCG